MGFSDLFKSKVQGNWKTVSSIEELDQIEQLSFTKPQIIFKHSIRCSISSMAKSRVESGIGKIQELADIYYLDLLSYRKISNEVESRYQVIHESPQIIILKDGKSIYDESHHMIKVEEILTHLG